MVIVEANKKDDQVDADGDGIADAKQISGRELLRRKVKLVLAKMNPEKVNTALAAIYKGMSGERFVVVACVLYSVHLC